AAVGAGDVCAGGVVAVGPLEREVVREDVGAGVEFDVFLAVVKRRAVGHRDAARVAVEGDAVLLVVEGYRAPDGVIDSNAVAAEFEAVAVAVGGRAAVRNRSVAKSNAILDGHWADRACVGLGEEIPAIINVVVRDAASEDVAGSRRQLAGEAVGVLAVVRVEVVEGIAIEDQ